MTTPAPADLRRIAHDSLALNESAFLKHYRFGRFTRWNGVALTASELPGPGFNFAAVIDAAPPLDDLLRTARDHFAHCTQGWGILVEGDSGHPMEAELIARGWTVAEDEPAFVIPDIAAASFDQELPRELKIRRARTEADRVAFCRITTEAFGAPPELADLVMPSLAFVRDPDMYWVIGEWEGEPVAASGYSRTGETAVVAGLATLEPYRGKGIGAALTRATLAHAARQGYRHASLRSGPKSIPLYKRLGFRYACQHRTYSCPEAS